MKQPKTDYKESFNHPPPNPPPGAPDRYLGEWILPDRFVYKLLNSKKISIPRK